MVADEVTPEDIQSGDIFAFKMVFVAYYEPLCHFAYGYTRRPDISEELVQDVFTHVWEHRKDWNPDNMNAWLYKAVRNRALDYLKHEKVVEKHMLEAWEMHGKEVTQDSTIDERDFNDAVNQTIRELPERCRTTFKLHRQEGLTYSEIAEIMGVSVKTVETQMSKALNLLRDRLRRFMP